MARVPYDKGSSVFLPFASYIEHHTLPQGNRAKTFKLGIYGNFESGFSACTVERRFTAEIGQATNLIMVEREEETARRQ